jgi:nitrate reductase NapE component
VGGPHRIGRRAPPRLLTRLADLALAVFGVYIVYRMLFGPPLLTMEAVAPESLRETLGSILYPMLKVALGIGLFGAIVDSIQKLVRAIRTGTTSA